MIACYGTYFFLCCSFFFRGHLWLLAAGHVYVFGLFNSLVLCLMSNILLRKNEEIQVFVFKSLARAHCGPVWVFLCSGFRCALDYMCFKDEVEDP